MKSTDFSSSPPSVLIYDENCRLCVTVKEGLERGCPQPALRFAPYQSQEARNLLGQLHHGGIPSHAFLVEPAGSVQMGIEAFLPFLSQVPGGRLIRFLLKIPLIRKLSHVLYDILARHRYRWFGAVRK